jgi:hypothetical protein
MEKMDQMEQMKKMLTNTKYEDQVKRQIVRPAQEKNRKPRVNKRNRKIPGYTQVSSKSTSSYDDKYYEDVHCITRWQEEDFGFAEHYRAFEYFKKKGMGIPENYFKDS